MQSKAATVEEYLASLPPDRRDALQAVRKVILANLDKGYQEGMGYGMMGYSVPHSIYPPGYHCDPKQPLPFAGLASQKNYMSVYLMSVYGPDSDEAWLRDAWAATGKKLDMGKCCIRFKKLEDLPLQIIGEAIRRMPVAKWIAYYEAAIRPPAKGKGGSGQKPAAKDRASAPARAKKATARSTSQTKPSKPKDAPSRRPSTTKEVAKAKAGGRK